MSKVTKFLTCGSVDDGKSTMIGKLLFDAGLIYEDQLQALKQELERNGKDTNIIDYSFLLDGLISEREQGITIDVAYRYFSLNNKKYIVADTPGHTQYTKNMATGASRCDAAIILIDARKGLGLQTRRHTLICAMMGIQRLLFAVNKFDLVNWQESVFNEIQDDCKSLINDLSQLGFNDIHYSITPVSALLGDNLLNKSVNMKWYRGGTIYDWLDKLEFDNNVSNTKFKFEVQYVIKSFSQDHVFQNHAIENLTDNERKNFRSYTGKILSGSLTSGQRVKISSTDIKSTVKGILIGFQFVHTVHKNDSVSLILEDEIDISRGDLIVSDDTVIKKYSEFTANVIWMSDQTFSKNRNYIIKGIWGYINANVLNIDYKYNLETFEQIQTDKLDLNEVGVVKIHSHSPIILEDYKSDKQLGSFIIIDRLSNKTVGCGMVRDLDENEPKTKPQNITQKPIILWFTGLSGSGKTTTSENLKSALLDRGYNSVILDGDVLRKGLCKDLGFNDTDRSENIRRTAEVAKLILNSGVNVMCSLISPFEKDRQTAREILSEYNFIEVFVDAPFEVCEERDAKGFYKKARVGEIKNFTGIGSNYEKPSNPEIIVNTDILSMEESVQTIIEYLVKKEVIY